MHKKLSLLVLVAGLVPALKADMETTFPSSVGSSLGSSFGSSLGSSLGYSLGGLLYTISHTGLEVSIGGFGGKGSFTDKSIKEDISKVKETEGVLKVSLSGVNFNSFGGKLSIYWGFGAKVFNVGTYLSGGLGLGDYSLNFGLFVGGQYDNYLYKIGLGISFFHCMGQNFHHKDILKQNIFIQFGYFFYKKFYGAIKIDYYSDSPFPERGGCLPVVFTGSSFSVSVCVGYHSTPEDAFIESVEKTVRATKMAELQAKADFAEMQKNKKSEAKLANA